MNYASNTAIILLIISTAFGIELFIELIGLVGRESPTIDVRLEISR